MRAEILRAMAMVEALIDFGEGEDIEEGVYESGEQLFLAFYSVIAESDNQSSRNCDRASANDCSSPRRRQTRRDTALRFKVSHIRSAERREEQSSQLPL